MLKHKGSRAVIVIGVSLATVTVVMALRIKGGGLSADRALQGSGGSDKQKAGKGESKQDFESQFPLVDHESPEPTDPEHRARRRAKGEKHNKAVIPLDEESDGIVSTRDWEVGLPALPVEQSQAIVVGRVQDAQAFLSTDKTAVYSEFTIIVEEVLKNTANRQLVAESSLVAERSGGRVRFPSGHVTLQSTRGQGMPRKGRQYVFFLTLQDQALNFSILTGYELKAGRVELLDEPGGGHPINNHRGVGQEAFLQELRTTITGRENR